MNAQPCPCCGTPLVVLPSGTVTTLAVVQEISDACALGEQLVERMEDDPEFRAVMGEHYEVEGLLDED